ncbi:MAG: universal stress protein [Chromatiales bacterium]|nr:universal stress protein [Chromatiales bacterium]
MFTKALVGIDFSPVAEPLVSCLPELKRWGIKEITLVHVVVVGYAQGSGYGSQETFRELLERQAANLRAAGLDVSVLVSAAGDAAEELVRLSHEEGADLIVVGSRSHNLLHRTFLGSTAREVLRRADLPVLIERIDPPEDGAETCAPVCAQALDRVLLATDLSGRSHAAEVMTLALAPACGAVDMITAHESGAEGTSARALDLAASLSRLAPSSRHLRAEGTARDAITAAARDYTLVILGKTDRNWAAGKVLVSTAAHVAEKAGRPVLLVPTAEGQASPVSADGV